MGSIHFFIIPEMILNNLQRAPLRFIDFLRAGVPITIVTRAVGVLLLWAFSAWRWI